jgi:hypothetical protein
MRTLLSFGAAALGGLAILGSLESEDSVPTPLPTEALLPNPVSAPQQARALVPCPGQTLLDHGVCVPVPEAPKAPETTSSLVERYPERPESFDAYSWLVSGGVPETDELGKAPDTAEVTIAALPESPILCPTWEDGRGCRVLFVDAEEGELLFVQSDVPDGQSAAPRHLFVLRDLGAIPADLLAGSVRAAETSLGKVGPLGRFRIETRRLNPEVSLADVSQERLLSAAMSASSDIRNAMPLATTE